MWEDFTDTLYILQKINLNLNSYKQLYCTAVESKTFPETETKKQKRRDKPKNTEIWKVLLVLLKSVHIYIHKF